MEPQIPDSYRWHSLFVAFLALMILICLARIVKTTTTIEPFSTSPIAHSLASP